MIDFRSDTVTQPCERMRQKMAQAEVGDDVYGDDPTVLRLQDYAKELCQVEAALFCSSGTQANLLGIMSHCQRGDEYLCGQQAHNYKYEAGGAAVLGSVQPQPVSNQADGSLDLSELAAAIKPQDFHFATTKLLSIENTIGGKVLPFDYVQALRPFVDQHQLALHLDGARVFNAVVKQQRSIVELTQGFDSFTICLSKGLGAPVGSLLLGSHDYIDYAMRLRKMLGGGMRQAGIIAAGGLFALEHNVQRLAFDHQHAAYLAEGLAAIDEFSCDPSLVQTNIVYARCEQQQSQALSTYLAEQGILISAGDPMRFVLHLGIAKQDVDTLLAAIKQFYRQG